MTLEEIKIKTEPILKRHDVEFAGVFGSYARGEATEKSDVDVLVRFSKPIGLFGLIGLERKLSETLDKKVDLATEGSLHRLIKDQVLSDLKVIYAYRQTL